MMSRSILRVIVCMTAIAGVLAACADDGKVTGLAPSAQGANGSPNADFVTFDPKTFNLIASGSNFTCAARNDGTTYCWGANDSLQSGGGASVRCANGALCITQPTMVLKEYPLKGPVSAIDMDAGSNHLCILDPAAAAWCWGSGGKGQNGQGGPSFGMRGPIPVVGNHKFESIGAGGDATCATSSSVLFCWGDGNPFIPSGMTNTPLAVSPNPGPIPIVVVGAADGCGLVPNKFGSTTAFCWGLNLSGQLGIPASSRAVPFVKLSDFGDSVAAMSMGSGFTCIDRSDGTVWCAGANGSGQLGWFDRRIPFFSTPQLIGGGMQLHGVTAGGAHACALDVANQAWCWGAGGSGQLGNERFEMSPSAQPVAGGIAFRRLAAGGSHTCGIGFDNNIYCWGSNSHGQLGIADKNGGVLATPRQTRDPQ